MFKKTKCSGCRKNKYFVKYREIRAPFGQGEPLRSLEKLCYTCGRKLKKLSKQINAK